MYSPSTWTPCGLYQPEQDLGNKSLCVPVPNLSTKQIVLLLFVSLKMFACNFKMVYQRQKEKRQNECRSMWFKATECLLHMCDASENP